MSAEDRSAWKRVTMLVSDGLIVVFFPDKENWNPITASKEPQKMARCAGKYKSEVAFALAGFLKTRATTRVAPTFPPPSR